MRIPRKQQSERALPAVNLLSPGVFEAIATRRLRARFVTAACALSLVIGAGWAVEAIRVNQAEQDLAVVQDEVARLSSQTRALAPVRSYVAAVEKQKHTVQTAMVSEVYVSRVLDSLRAATPAGVNVLTASVTLATPEITGGAGAPTGAAVAAGTNPCPGPDPFLTRPAVGCITLTGSADNRGVVGDFVITLGASAMFVEPFVSTTTTTTTSTTTTAPTAPGDSVAFTGSVGVSPKVLSRRYADLDRLLAPGGNQ